jgi:ketosteroid isomerase-like protein
MGALREIWEAGIAAYNAGQLEQVAQLYADDAVLSALGPRMPGARQFWGCFGIR